MNCLNQIILEGNLVKNAEIKTFVTGTKVAQFTIAVNRSYRNSNSEVVQEVSYFDIEAFGSMAICLTDELKKGRGVRVVGRLKQDRWKDSSGKNCSKIFVIAEHIEVKAKKEA